MLPRFLQSALAIALALSVGIFALPGCSKKKPKPTAADTPAPAVAPSVPAPAPISDRDPQAPRSPVFATGPRGAAVRAAAENNMKEIVLALHAFHDANAALPAGYADKTGKPGLSWRVAILPYLDGGANLFNLFKLDEAWDSEHNKTLIDKMPKAFAPPKENTNGYTFARGFTGPNTWLPPQTQPLQPGRALLGARITQFTDGTANTFLVAEAYAPVIWTKPDEMQFDPNNLPKLGGVFASGAIVGMADGSVKLIRPGLEPKTIASAIQINDGGIVNFDN